MPAKLKSLKGVEIFSAGVWNGDEYSEKDLDEMVRAFEETAKTFRPALKLGHDDNQVLLQRDGLPAAGWVGALYRKGKKLLADFIDIPEKVFELIQRGAYKRVSSEVYWNAEVNGGKYRRLVGAVALLGADLPGVTNLSEIFKMYDQSIGELRHYDLDKKSFTINLDLEKQGDLSMTEKEQLAKLEADLTAEKQKNHSLQTESSKKQKELEDQVAELKKFVTDAQAREEEAKKQAAQAELEKEVTGLVAEKLVSPAMKPYVLAILSEEKKEYSIKPEKGDEKKFSKAGLLKEILKLHTHASTVNVDESSEEGEGDKEPGTTEALHQKIEQYSKEHKCSYKDAYKAVMATVADADDEDSDDEDDDA